MQDEIGLNEWSLSLRAAHKNSLELLSSMARKAGKIYGAEIEANSRSSPIVNRSANGGNQIWDDDSKDKILSVNDIYNINYEIASVPFTDEYMFYNSITNNNGA